MDQNEYTVNNHDEIRVTREFDSNVIDESDAHHEKHPALMISTLREIEIDRSDEGENASN
jgi:hypothetical protein